MDNRPRRRHHDRRRRLIEQRFSPTLTALLRIHRLACLSGLLPVEYTHQNPVARWIEAPWLAWTNGSGERRRSMKSEVKRRRIQKPQLKVVLETNILYSGTASDLVQQEAAKLIKESV